MRSFGQNNFFLHGMLILLTCPIFAPPANAQNFSFSGNGPVAFGQQQESGELSVSAKLVPIDAVTVDVQVTVTLPDHNYIYSTNPSFSEASKISIMPVGQTKVEREGPIRADRKPKSGFDKDMGQVLEKFYDNVTWTQRLKSTTGPFAAEFSVNGELRGMYCSSAEHGGQCRPIRPARKFTAALPADYKPSGAAASTVASTPDRPNSASKTVIIPKMKLPSDLTKPPITFTVSLTPEAPVSGEYVTLSIKAEIDEPFHTYSVTLDPEILGATPTEIKIAQVTGAEATWDAFRATPKPSIEMVEGLNDPFEMHHGTVEWTQEYVVTGDSVEIEGSITYQVCDETQCLPLTETPFRVALGGNQSEADVAVDEGSQQDEASFGKDTDRAGLIAFILSAIGFGYISLLTPCVFPMIPVTVAYFLKQGSERPGQTIKLASIYCAGIIGAFTILGLLAAILFGPAAINQLANDRWLNLGLAGIFIIFALILMGMFEIRLPSWLLTWSSKKQEGGGVMGVLFMALTFTLVSFTCTFAFVGQLLVLAANGNYMRPVIGMLAFSTAFASPFFFLAMFPTMLTKLPKSGGWMNSVKVTMGLLELAIVSKFLSVADTGFSPTGTPQFLDYHLVMASWIAVAGVTGLYLLGLFRMPHDTPDAPIGPVRCLFSLGFVGLAAYITVGLFAPNAPNGMLWQQIVAFAPPQIEFTSDAEGHFVEHDGLTYNLDFDSAVQAAESTNTPLFLDFTGVNCINCRRMEQGVLASSRVHSILKDLVLAQLYVDLIPGVDKASKEHERLLTRNRSLQENWYGDVSIPAYVIATPDGKSILATFKGMDTTGDQFQRFLTAGLSKWNSRNAVASTSGH